MSEDDRAEMPQEREADRQRRLADTGWEAAHAAHAREQVVPQQGDHPDPVRAPGETADRLAPPNQPKTLIDEVIEARAQPPNVSELVAPAVDNPKLPDDMRTELPLAMAKLQEVSPHAPGLATRVVAGHELGRSSPPGSGGTVWEDTVQSDGQPHGFAYEVIATARLIDASRTPGNGNQEVRIVQGDELIFGAKLPAGEGRRTVEADTLIVKPDGYKIGIDAKAYSGPLPESPGLNAELEHVKEAIRQGEVHEFHFASRGPMSPGAKRAIEDADRELRTEIKERLRTPLTREPTISELQAARVDPSHALICWHENFA